MLGVVIQIDAREPVTGAAVPLRAASHDHPDVCHLTDQVAWPVIAKLPRLGYDLFDGAFEGRIETPSASMSIGIEPWPAFASLAIADTRFRLWTGEVGAPLAAWTQRVEARVTQQPAIVDGRAELTFAVDDRWLDRALLATYAGTTGAEGPATIRGQIKPLALGAPRYVPGVLVDPVTSLFQISGHGPIVAVDAALERLLRYGPPIRDYPTLAELLAAAIPAGCWATALSGGWARFGAPPIGQVCFMVRGDAGSPDGWSRRPGQQIRRLALLSGGAGRVADASLNALDLARPYDLSLYLDQQTTARALIQEVAASVNAVAGVSWMGRLFVRPVAIGAPTLTLAADGAALPPVSRVRQLEVAPPFGKLAITAERTWSVHALADIAFTATLIDMGAWAAATTYREGNIVQQQGSSWVYTNPVPSAGNAPPQLPTLSNAYWRVLAKAGDPGTDAETYTLSSIGLTASREAQPAGYRHGLWKGDGTIFVDPDNGNTSADFARSYSVCWRRSRNDWKVRHFDVYGNGEITYPADDYAGGDRHGVQGMINLLASIPAGTPVAIYTSDEPAGNHAGRADLIAQILSCGGSRARYVDGMRVRGAYTLVGVKGWAEGRGYETVFSGGDASRDAVIQTTFSIIGGIPASAIAGLPGEKGKDGQTWYQYFAYANSPDGAVDFTTGAPAGRSFVGFAHGTSPDKPTAPEAYAWSEYKGPPFGIATRGRVVAAGRQLIKTGGTNDWDSDAYSTIGFRGGAVASFRPGQTNCSIMAGLNTDPTADASYGSLDYAWYIVSDGTSQIYENGQWRASFGAYSTDTAYQVLYDGRYVVYYANGIEHRRVDHGANALFYFDSSFATPGGRLYDVDFAARGADGLKGADGINPPLVTIAASPQLLRYIPGIGYVGGPVTFTATLTNAIGPVSFSSANGHQLYGRDDISFGTNTMTINAARMQTVVDYNESQGWGAHETIVASAGGASARVSVTKIVDGAKGDPVFGFVQEDNPGNGQFDRQIWYQPAARQSWYWLNGQWNRTGGLLAAQDLIASSAQIGNLVVIGAHIRDLEVSTLKIANQAVSNSVAVQPAQTTFRPPANGQAVICSVSTTAFGAGAIRIDFQAVIDYVRYSQAGNSAQYYLRRNQGGAYTEVGGGGYLKSLQNSSSAGGTPNAWWMDTPEAGSVTYEVVAVLNQDNDPNGYWIARQIWIVLQEMKR